MLDSGVCWLSGVYGNHGGKIVCKFKQLVEKYMKKAQEGGYHPDVIVVLGEILKKEERCSLLVQ